jgi:protein required for attachment to host cells
MTRQLPLLVLVMDGRRAILFSDGGTRRTPEFRVLRQWQWRNPANREQRRDAPGRTISSAEPAQRSSYDEVDRHARREEQAAIEVAHALDDLAADSVFDRLVVCAPPRMLGHLRRHLTAPVLRRLFAELAKDMLHQPTEVIERQVRQELERLAASRID